PGTMSKIFSSHPMTDDRIKTSQKTIQDILKAKPEYVVTTSEFNDVKGRLMTMHNRRKPDDKDAGRPRLRRAPGGGTIPVDENGNEQKQKEDQDERPTLSAATSKHTPTLQNRPTTIRPGRPDGSPRPVSV